MRIIIIQGTFGDLLKEEEEGIISFEEPDTDEAHKIASFMMGYGFTVVLEPNKRSCNEKPVDMNSLLIHDYYSKTMSNYSNEEIGRLFKAMLAYVETGEDTQFDGNERFIWPILKQQIDQDKETYEEHCEDEDPCTEYEESEA